MKLLPVQDVRVRVYINEKGTMFFYLSSKDITSGKTIFQKVYLSFFKANGINLKAQREIENQSIVLVKDGLLTIFTMKIQGKMKKGLRLIGRDFAIIEDGTPTYYKEQFKYGHKIATNVAKETEDELHPKNKETPEEDKVESIEDTTEYIPKQEEKVEKPKVDVSDLPKSLQSNSLLKDIIEETGELPF